MFIFYQRFKSGLKNNLYIVSVLALTYFLYLICNDKNVHRPDITVMVDWA